MSEMKKYIDLIENVMKSKSGNTLLTNFIKKNLKGKGLRLSFEYIAENIMSASLVFSIEEPENIKLVKSLCDTIKQYGEYDSVDYDKDKNIIVITIVHDEVDAELENITI